MPDVDLSEFFKYSRPKKPPCKIGFILSQLKPKEKKELEAACAQDGNIITASAILTWLEARGHSDGLSPNAIGVHRNGRCNCAK